MLRLILNLVAMNFVLLLSLSDIRCGFVVIMHLKLHLHFDNISTVPSTLCKAHLLGAIDYAVYIMHHGVYLASNTGCLDILICFPF